MRTVLLAVCLGAVVAALGPLNTQEKQFALDLHNQYRNEITTSLPDRNGNFPATPGDVRVLLWDKDLAEAAQKMADACPHVDHNNAVKDGPEFWKVRINHRDFPGENLAAIGSSYGSNEGYLRNAIDYWIKTEASAYDWQTNTCHPTSEVGMCTHMTQALWHSTEYLGCAVNHNCAGYTSVVCEYMAGGNIAGQPVFPLAQDPANPCSTGLKPHCDYPNLCRVDGVGECQPRQIQICNDRLDAVRTNACFYEMKKQNMANDICEGNVKLALDQCAETCGFCKKPNKVLPPCWNGKGTKACNNRYNYGYCNTDELTQFADCPYKCGKCREIVGTEEHPYTYVNRPERELVEQAYGPLVGVNGTLSENEGVFPGSNNCGCD